MKYLRFLACLSAYAAFAIAPAFAGESTTIPAGSSTPQIPAYVAHPAGSKPMPGVLVLHGCEGYSKTYAGIADDLASKGYVAVAIDSLAPQGIGTGCGDKTQSRIEADDARAALAWMRAQPFIDGTHLAVLGYSMGAIAVLDVMDSRKISMPPAGLVAAVAFYPACALRDPASMLVPLRILDGDADDWTPAPPCQTLAQDATTAGKTVQITTYPGATHAFNFNTRDRTVMGHHLHYDAAAATDAETQLLSFLSKYL